MFLFNAWRWKILCDCWRQVSLGDSLSQMCQIVLRRHCNAPCKPLEGSLNHITSDPQRRGFLIIFNWLRVDKKVSSSSSSSSLCSWDKALSCLPETKIYNQDFKSVQSFCLWHTGLSQSACSPLQQGKRSCLTQPTLLCREQTHRIHGDNRK